MRRRNATAPMQRVHSIIVLAVLPFITSFKPVTHLDVGALAIKELTDGMDSVTIDGLRYPVNPRLAESLRDYPSYYRGGVIGPDGFPDLVFGQSIIHPDSRCANGESLENQCLTGHGSSFSYEWLEHVFDSGWKYDNEQPDVAGKRALAFTYGYLTHAAGDLWAHTFVNRFAGGIFPGPAEIIADPPLANVAARHIVVEGFVGSHTPADPLELDSPRDFVYHTFIENGRARQLGKGSHFDKFFKLRDALKTTRQQAAENESGCILADVLLPFSCTISKKYLEEWIEDIEDGLRAWPEMSERVAQQLFTAQSVDGALGVVHEFVNEHLLGMLGTPDAVGSSLEVAREASVLITKLTDDLNPLSDMKDWLFRQAFGLSIEDFKKYYTNPGTYIASSEIGFSGGTRTDVRNLMSIEDGKYDSLNFRPFQNAVVLSRLLLLDSLALDRLLYDHHVGRIYTGSVLQGSPMRKNAMLGFVRSLDANDQWRRRSPSNVPAGGRIHGGAVQSSQRRDDIGMPLWTDCLARARVFRKIFQPWESVSFSDSAEPCEIISDPLPPVEVITEGQSPQTHRACLSFDRPYGLQSHSDERQEFVLYVVVLRVSALKEDTVFHWLRRGALEPLARFDTTVGYTTCEEAGFRIEAHLRRTVMNLPISAAGNLRIYPEAPLLPGSIQQLTTWLVEFKPGSECPISQDHQCPVQIIPGSTEGGGFTLGAVCNQTITCLGASGKDLDVDRDGFDDSADNCVVIANDPQTDSDDDGIGDACESKASVTGVLRGWLSGRISDARLPLAFKRLVDLGRMRVPPRNGICLTCGRNFTKVKPWIQQWTRQHSARRMSDVDLHDRLSGLIAGISNRVFNASVREASMDFDQQLVRYTLDAVGPGTISVTIPTSILAAPSGGDVRINGRPLRVKVLQGGPYMIYEIPFTEGAQTIEIRGKTPTQP